MDINVIKRWKSIQAEIDAVEAKKNEVSKKKERLTADMVGLQSAFERASDKKEAALVLFAKGDISQDELDSARAVFSTAENNLSRARDVMPAQEQLLWEMGIHLAELAEKLREAEKAVWMEHYLELRSDILKATGNKVHHACIALSMSGRFGAYGAGHELESLFEPQWERDDKQAWVKRQLEEFSKMKV